jgi:hypothetical protein
MVECKHLHECEFVLRYVEQVKPHWDDFVTLYCRGVFKENCKRFESFEKLKVKPAPTLMPTGHSVPDILDKK